MNNKKIGLFIASLRKDKNMTQKELADKLYISDQAVSKWERGLSMPDIGLIEKLSDYLEVSVSEILKGEKVKESIPFFQNKCFKNIITRISIIVIITLTLLLIGIYDIMLNYYDAVIKNYSQLLIDKNEKFVQIERYKYYDGVNGVSDLGALTDTDVKNINQRLKEMGKTGQSIYRLAHFMPGTGAGEVYVDKDGILEINENIESNPYTYWYDEIDVVEWNNFDNFFINDIIGRVPSNYNEILVSNHLADLLIEAGIKSYGEDDYYKPFSYESLIASDKYFHFGIDKVKIVGIINYDLSGYEILKNMSWSEYNANPHLYSHIGEELSDKTKNIYNKIFVNNEFVNHLVVNDSNIPGTSYPQYKISKTSILVMENTQEGFLNLLSEFKHDEPISARTTYSEYVDLMEMASYWYLKRLIYPIIILVALSAFLISKFVLSKQELKSERIRNLFVNKKYLWKIIPIAVVSVTLLSFISIFIAKYLLPIMLGEDKIHLNVFEISIRQFAVLFLSMIIIIIISYLISIVRIRITYKNR